MKWFLKRTAFFGTILVLTLVLCVPGYWLGDWAFPAQRDSWGLYHNGGFFPNGLIGIVCLWLANRLVGAAFLALGLTRYRWSMFAVRRD